MSHQAVAFITPVIRFLPDFTTGDILIAVLLPFMLLLTLRG